MSCLWLAPNWPTSDPPHQAQPQYSHLHPLACWSNTTDYVVELLLQLTCCVVDELGRWWLRVKKCCIMSARNRCIYTQIVWRDVTCVTVWHVTSNTYSTVRTITNMCLHYIWVEVPTTCAHSSDGSCKVHAWLQHRLRQGPTHVMDTGSVEYNQSIDICLLAYISLRVQIQ